MQLLKDHPKYITWRVPAICLDDHGEERKSSQDTEEIKLLKETNALKLGRISDYHE